MITFEEADRLTKMYKRDMEQARKQDSNTLKNWIWAAVSNGQPIPGCLSVENVRAVLRERGEDGMGFHGT